MITHLLTIDPNFQRDIQVEVKHGKTDPRDFVILTSNVGAC